MEKAILQIAHELREIKKELQHLNKTLEREHNSSVDCRKLTQNISRQIEEQIRELS